MNTVDKIPGGNHWHKRQEGSNHDHAFPKFPHSHWSRAICHKPECDGYPTHDIHAAPR